MSNEIIGFVDSYSFPCDERGNIIKYNYTYLYISYKDKRIETDIKILEQPYSWSN